MLADASAKLIDLLRIRTQPIGMRLFEDPADMEKIQGVRKPTDGFKFTMCQMVTQSRWYGFTLGITVDNTRGGNCGGVVGLNHPGEGFLSGDHMNGVWFGNKEASAAHQAQMPRVPDGKYNGLVVSPLRSARLDPPDICLFYGTPGQMIYFINGLQFHRYRRYDFTCTGESACADSWGRALATRQTSLSLPCYAERRYGGVADDELLMACPPDEFLRAIEGMGHLGKNGLRYPFPPYGAAMDPAFGMAKSYG
ncbi:MAG TPA: DUF169 domain-containing protein [Reyranella sp.]|jgi:uncharacterized protein (DUF169 family)|nr:DUF169 domain-containing protein [Reyranella sp.]HYI07106.1 DUF169 domain-containing protein [Reyranella sp.]HZB55051.1 DUF169 domain-containing protein [Reyranella sp.]